MKRYVINKVDLEHGIFQAEDWMDFEYVWNCEKCWYSPGSSWIVTDVDTGESKIFTKAVNGESEYTYV